MGLTTPAPSPSNRCQHHSHTRLASRDPSDKARAEHMHLSHTEDESICATLCLRIVHVSAGKTKGDISLALLSCRV